jgi:hypothetical protein
MLWQASFSAVTQMSMMGQRLSNIMVGQLSGVCVCLDHHVYLSVFWLKQHTYNGPGHVCRMRAWTNCADPVYTLWRIFSCNSPARVTSRNTKTKTFWRGLPPKERVYRHCCLFVEVTLQTRRARLPGVLCRDYCSVRAATTGPAQTTRLAKDSVSRCPRLMRLDSGDHC